MTLAPIRHWDRPFRQVGLQACMTLILAVFLLPMHALAQSSVRPPVGAVESAEPPANPSVRAPGGGATSQPQPVDPTAGKGAIYDTDMWRQLRRGISGTVSIPDRNAAQLIQSHGEAWRNLRNGPLVNYGAWAMGGMIVLLAVFFLLRGRIRLNHAWSGRTIMRFTSLERTGHWLLAVSFIILGITGLATLYGRYVLEPVVGKAGFAAFAALGKIAHNYVAFAFMVGLALTFAMWVRHNLPSWRDVVWLLQGGGILWKSHPPAWKFNAGQKILFWLVMLGGLSISLSGIALMFPFQTTMFAKTFAIMNSLGFAFPTDLTPLQEMQLATTWHGIVALFLIVVILAHIYIGTLGMEGAFDAMSSGEVDENWAREHHSLWAEQEIGKRGRDEAAGAVRPAPAE